MISFSPSSNSPAFFDPFFSCDFPARLTRKFQKIRDQYNSPEEINDSPQSHPSKRITEIIPTYKKPLNGSQAAAKIGLDKMKQECPHFRDWLKRLEPLRKDSNIYSEY